MYLKTRSGLFILSFVLEDRRTTSNSVAQRLRNMQGTNDFATKVCRRLGKHNLSSRKPTKSLKLLAHHRQKRLKIAREPLYWTIDQWEKVFFTDESNFNSRSPVGRK